MQYGFQSLFHIKYEYQHLQVSHSASAQIPYSFLHFQYGESEGE